MIAPDLHLAAPDMRGSGGIGMGMTEPLEVTTLFEEEVHEAYLEIVDSQGGEVVTVIEILSPANKTPGADGRESYLKKRREVLRSSTHMVEIDLLRRGRRSVPADTLPPCEYVVHVSRSDRRPVGQLWPIRLVQPLPTIAVPLLGSEASVPLDLQAVLSQAYDNAGYDLTIDYSTDPPLPALSNENAEWMRALLQTARKR